MAALLTIVLLLLAPSVQCRSVYSNGGSVRKEIENPPPFPPPPDNRPLPLLTFTHESPDGPDGSMMNTSLLEASSQHEDAVEGPPRASGRKTSSKVGNQMTNQTKPQGRKRVARSTAACTENVCQNARDLYTWMKVLYKGITYVPTYSDFGDILVYGEHAFPLLKAPDRNVSILVGVELGSGRLLAASHNEYANLFKDSYSKEAYDQNSIPRPCRSTVKGNEYEGAVSQTVGGLDCQEWAQQTPNSHIYTDLDDYPDISFEDTSNSCRNPSYANKPWCYTVNSVRKWDYCDTPLCPGTTQDCRDTEKGTEYMGTVNVTESGKTCQAWADQSPHTHTYKTTGGFPDGSYNDLGNYCRNPGGDARPWCYTTDPDTRWEYCDTPACPDPGTCRSEVQGKEYKGTVAETVGGLTCQRWDEQAPHSHSYTDASVFPDSTLEEVGNGCRNPSGSSNNKPWCYTTDPNKQWDYCNTPLCPGVRQECRLTSKGTEYMGTVNVTESGRTCQAWAANSPHSHNLKNVGGFPEDSFDDVGNYCRNPGGDARPWCYTTDPAKRWEYCDTPACPDGNSMLVGNMRRWLSKGNYQSEDNVCYLDSSSSMSCLDNPETMIAVWDGEGEWPTDEDDTRLLSWVQGGGGLLFALKAWGWQYYKTAGKEGQYYSEIPFYNIVEAAGLAFDYSWYKTDPLLTVPTTKEERETLINMNHLYMANQIQTVADSDENSAWVDGWLSRVSGGTSQWLYPQLMTNLHSVMGIVTTRLEDEMQWPEGSIHNEVGLQVTPADQRMYKVYYEQGVNGQWKSKAINVDKFPGDVDGSLNELETYTFEISSTEYNTWSTGMYLPAGQDMTVNVISADNDDYKKFEILLGCHPDKLYSKTTLYRFPRISRWVKIDSPTMTLKSVHGGLISVWSPSSETPNYIKVEFGGLVEAPYFILNEPTSVAQWSSRRDAPGMWADIVGRWQRFTLPSESVRNFDTATLQTVMETWDEVVKTDYELMGKPIEQWRRQWASSDIQISVGSMHAGYPIGMHLDKGRAEGPLFVLAANMDQHWGMYHEIGHNLQESMWTFSDTVEVTTNIFSMYQTWRLFGDDPLTVQLYSTVYGSGFDNYLADPVYGNCWKSAWVALLPYSQLATHFGFDCYHKVFSTYYNDPNSPTDNQVKRDQWVHRWSEAVGYNLCPVYDFFSLPLSESMCQSLPYTPYLPYDIITQKPNAAALVNAILQKYPGIVRTIDTTPDCPAIAEVVAKRK